MKNHAKNSFHGVLIIIKTIKLARSFKPGASFWAWGVPQPLQPWGRTKLRSETRGGGGLMWCDMVTWLTDGGCSVFVWKKITQIIAWKKSRTNFWCCHETFEWLFGANYITLWMLFFFTWFFKHLGWFKLWHDCPFQHPNKGSQWLHWGKPPTEVSQDDKIPQPFTPCSQEKDCRTAEADVLFPNTWVMSLGTFLCMRVFGKEGHKNI